MLRTRVITAVVMLAVLLALFSLNSLPVIVVASACLFAAASWESFRLFGNKHPIVGAAIWAAAFAFLAFSGRASDVVTLFAVCVAIWAVRLTPALALGLPPLGSFPNRLLTIIYGIALLGCFPAILALYKHSAIYLVSVMVIVWVADIGAYFTGKAFGKRKLAPTISPGKSWEGAIGGWLTVLVLAALSTLVPVLHDTFAVKLQERFGWAGFVLAMTLIVAASVVGDLFESLLKRRAGAKDSSKLLPGHGGILDRIDALIPVLPLAVLFGLWF